MISESEILTGVALCLAKKNVLNTPADYKGRTARLMDVMFGHMQKLALNLLFVYINSCISNSKLIHQPEFVLHF